MSLKNFNIGKHRISETDKCFLIAEVAQAHDGSLGTAHAFIDAIANAGADAVKFQTHVAALESSAEEPWRVHFSKQDKTRYDYWKRMEFTEEQWLGLKLHAEEKGLIFLSSPFSDYAVEFLDRIGMLAWKIASGELYNPRLLDKIHKTGKPILISTGMSSMDEIENVINKLKPNGVDIGILQCSSSYPTRPEKLGLNMLEVYRKLFGYPVGLSDHSGTIYAGLAAASLGANILEVHVTFSREMFGPDVVASVTTTELAQLAQGLQFINAAIKSPVNKDEVLGDYADIKRIFTKSIFAARDIPVGKLISESDLICKKPGTGIPATNIASVLGKYLIKSVAQGEMLKLEDIAS